MTQSKFAAIQARPKQKRAPSKANHTTFGYAQLKKYVSRFHHFSFPNPRKGKDFTRSQKSAITCQFNKLQKLIVNLQHEKNSFINTMRMKKSDIPAHDGVKTNKGFFFKFPYTKIKKIKDKLNNNKPISVLFTDFRLIRFSKLFTGSRSSDIYQFYFMIPNYYKSVDGIIEYRQLLIDAYKPDFVMMSAHGRLYSTQLDVEEFMNGSGKNALRKKEDEDYEEDDEENYENNFPDFITGIIVGYFD